VVEKGEFKKKIVSPLKDILPPEETQSFNQDI
jgi:hypothetical protein